jgi:hypothetical protein
MFLVWRFFFVGNLLSVVLVLFPDMFKPLLTIPVAAMITGMTKHFTFHIRWISVLITVYILIYFQPSFVLHGIVTFINKQILSLFVNYCVWPVRQNLSVCTPWSNNTVFLLNVHFPTYYYYYYYCHYYHISIKVYMVNVTSRSSHSVCRCWNCVRPLVRYRYPRVVRPRTKRSLRTVRISAIKP